MIPPTCLCFYLVVTVTPKHWATLNGIPACHQSPVDKDVIVVVSEWHMGRDGGGRGGNVHEAEGTLCGLDRRTLN